MEDYERNYVNMESSVCLKEGSMWAEIKAYTDQLLGTKEYSKYNYHSRISSTDIL